MYLFDVEEPAFFVRNYGRDQPPRSRRARKCCECLCEIRAGDRYERNTGKWDGRIETFVACVECAELREAVERIAEREDELVAFGELADYMAEPETLDQLDQGLIEKWEARQRVWSGPVSMCTNAATGADWCEDPL